MVRGLMLPYTLPIGSKWKQLEATRFRPPKNPFTERGSGALPYTLPIGSNWKQMEANGSNALPTSPKNPFTGKGSGVLPIVFLGGVRPDTHRCFSPAWGSAASVPVENPESKP